MAEREFQLTPKGAHTGTPLHARAHARVLEEAARRAGQGGAGAGPARREEVAGRSQGLRGHRRESAVARAMEAEPPLYPMAGAAGPQGDEDRLGVPDGPEAPVSGDQQREGQGSPVGRGGPGGSGHRGARVRGAIAGASGMRGPQLDELVGAYPNYNEEEEERRYYRRKRLGVLKNVLAASAGGMLTYGVYLGRCRAGTQGRPARSQPGPGNRNRGPRPPARSHFPSAALAAAATAPRGGGGVGRSSSAASPGPSQSLGVGGGRGSRLRDRPAPFGNGGWRSKAGGGLGQVAAGWQKAWRNPDPRCPEGRC